MGEPTNEHERAFAQDTWEDRDELMSEPSKLHE